MRETPTVLFSVPGVRLQYHADRPSPYGVWIEARIGTKGSPFYRKIRGARFNATEPDGKRAFNAAVTEVANIRAEIDVEEGKLRAVEEVANLPPAPRGVTLFATLARDWMEQHVRTKDAGTYRNYLWALDCHLLPVMKAWPVSSEHITAKRLKDLLGATFQSQGVSLSTRRACCRCLSALFGWALSESVPHLTFNPAAGLGRHLKQANEQPHKRKPPNPMTTTQAAALPAWIQEHARSVWEWFFFLFETGVRQGEASAVKWEHLHLDEGKAHIVDNFSASQRWLERKRGDLDGTGEKDTKTHRTDQWIDLSPLLVTALRDLQAEQRREAFRCGRKLPKHVFVNSQGRPQRPDSIVRKVFREGCTKLELVGQTGRSFTMHDIRDTFATLAILHGVSVGWVSMMLGHEDEDTTRTYYYKWIRLIDNNPLAAEEE